MTTIIHIGIRKNSIYIICNMLFFFIRRIVIVIIDEKYKYNDSLIFTLLMLLGEFVAGLSIFIYLSYQFRKKGIDNNKHFRIELIQNDAIMKRPDNIPKILLLIFFTSYFDFLEYVIATVYMPKYSVISPTAELRFGGIIIILAALICHFVLKIKLVKHQFYSLVIIGISLIIIIIIEIIYRGKGKTLSEFCSGYLLVLYNLVLIPFTDVIEKYLMEFDFLNPFLILTFQSFFGLILVAIYSAGENPFKGIKRIHEESSNGDFILLLLLLFMYFVLSGILNSYRVLTNCLFSPMVKTLSVYILNPLFYLYYFIKGYDFISEGERKWAFFIINIIISIIISFFWMYID